MGSKREKTINNNGKQDIKSINRYKMSIKSNDLKTDVIKVVPNYTIKCINDKETLKKVDVMVSYYDIISEKKIGVIKAQGLICKLCKAIYFTAIQYNELKNSLNNKKIKIIEENKKDSNIRYEIISKDLGCNTQVKNIDEKKIEKTITISDLTKLGYSVKKPKKFRREILEKDVIPEFGVNNTINVMEILINQFMERRDYTLAVREWKSDLKDIKKKHFI